MATTWTNPDAVVDVNRVRVAKAACTTGTEVSAQGAAHLKDGIALWGLDSVTPHIEMPAGSGTATLSAGLAAAEKVTIAGHDFVARARYAVGTATLVNTAAGNKVTLGGHDFVARARYAKGTITITTAVARNSAIVNGIAFDAVANGAGAVGTQWTVGAGGTANADSATALAAAITAARARCKCTAAAVGAVVTITSTVEAPEANTFDLVAIGAPLALSGASLSGAYDSSLDEFPILGTDALTAAALAAAINASKHAAVKNIVTAAAVATNVCTITSVAEGAAGNAVTLVRTGAPITVSGATLAGAYDASVDEWPVLGTLALSAGALAAAINASVTAGVAGVVTAAAANAVVTITGKPGSASNAVTLAETGAHIAVSGATLAGGLDIAANASLQVSLLNPSTGLWDRAPDLDMPLLAALGAQGLPGIPITGPAARLQALPYQVGAGCSVCLNGHPRSASVDR